MRVLIVEPSKDMARIIKDYLDSKGFTAYIAHTSQEGIYIADKNKPDIVILELLMSGHNGLEFIYEFKSYNDWFDIPIVIYSDLSAEELGPVAGWEEDMNITGHFYKPAVSLEKLSSHAMKVVNER